MGSVDFGVVLMLIVMTMLLTGVIFFALGVRSGYERGRDDTIEEVKQYVKTHKGLAVSQVLGRKRWE